jgi:hypothetical protein
MFIIEDDFHAEFIGEKFDTFDSAILELRKISAVPFGNIPNKPPCVDWQNCQRDYQIVEYDDTQTPWKLIAKTQVLNISASKSVWLYTRQGKNLQI